MNINEIKDLDSFLNNEYIKNVAIKNRLEEEIKEESKNIEKYHKEIEVYEKKKKLLQDAAKEAREFSAEMFELVSTEALQTILGENLSVKIDFGEKNGTQTADFLIKSTFDDKEIIVDPTDESGGGAADIVSLASLISMNSFVSDENSAPLILDEPTKYVSKGNAKDVALFLSETSKNMNKQIIMVTHDEVSKDFADVSYEIKLNEEGNSVSSLYNSKNLKAT